MIDSKQNISKEYSMEAQVRIKFNSFVTRDFLKPDKTSLKFLFECNRHH